MSRTPRAFIFKTAFAVAIALCSSSAVFGQTAAPATGLGQSWPNATDVSASPNWHVYVFMLNGIKYVQVNDLNGTVHAAVGATNGTTVVLPVGVDSQNVSASPSTGAQTVYSDSTTTVTASPQSNGTTKFSAQDSCPTGGCSGGGGP